MVPFINSKIKRNLYYKIKDITNLYNRLVLREKRFPPEVWIENTNFCNAQCVMCPRDSHVRKQAFMEFGLFEKLIKEIAKFNNIVRRIHLHNFGEPLLDKDLAKRIKFAKAYYIKHTYFVTNAYLLSPKRSEEIITAGLDEFKISFYGTDHSTYNNTMLGLNFGTTMSNIKEFFKIRKRMNRRKPNVIIQYVPHQNNGWKVKEFFNLFSSLIDKSMGDRLYIFPLHNYGGVKSYIETKDKILNICKYPWRTTVILNDGKVAACPMDYNGFEILGNVKDNTIEEIWNNPKYKLMRQNFKKLLYDDYAVCPRCEITRY